jgi:hypothetical protein
MGSARDDIARLTAIARLIRRLHVMHLFTDADGRLRESTPQRDSAGPLRAQTSRLWPGVTP